MKATARAAALSIVAVLVLAGCLKVDMDLTLNSDDTVSGSVTMAVEEGTGEALGLSDEELGSQMFSDTESGLPNGDVTEYNEDGFIGQTMTFEDAPLTEFGDGSDGMQLYRDGDFYVIESETSPVDGTEADQLPDSAEATLTVTFPGSIEDANGVVDGNTVTWNLFEVEDGIYARGGVEPDAAFSLWIILAIGLGVGVAVGIAMWLISRNKRADATADEAGYPLAHESEQVAPPVPVNPSQPAAPAPTRAPAAPTAEDSVAPTPEAPASAYPDVPANEADRPSPDHGGDDAEGDTDEEPTAR